MALYMGFTVFFFILKSVELFRAPTSPTLHDKTSWVTPRCAECMEYLPTLTTNLNQI